MVLLISLDIDGTQFLHHDPDDTDAYVLKSYLEGLRESRGAVIVHNTGRPYPWRHYGDADDRFTNPVLAEPDAIIHSAGTKINYAGQDPYAAWEDHLGSLVTMTEMAHLRKTLQEEGVPLHPESLDPTVPYKVSCLVKPEEQAAKVRVVQRILEDFYPDRFEVSYWNPWTIDLTPKGANKMDALNFLRREMGIEHFPIVGAGDSMNDYPVLSHENVNAIIVGNASDDFKEQFNGKSNVFIVDAQLKGPRAVYEGIRYWIRTLDRERMLAPA